VVGNGHGEPWEQVVSSRPNLVTESLPNPISTSSALRFLSNMSRRAAIVEEFDDDTDLPLPSLSLPNTSRGAIIEEIMDTDDDEGGESEEAPELLDQSAIGGSTQPSVRDTRVTDITPYKKYANAMISNVIGQWPTHSPHLGGHVFIQFTLMQSDRMEPVLGGYRDPRACGGLSAKTWQMPALASAWAHCTKSTRCTRPTGRTRVAYAYNGRRTVYLSMPTSERVCPSSRTGANREPRF
jgi:hypothetical protein